MIPGAASDEKVVNMTTYWYQFMTFFRFPQKIPLVFRKWYKRERLFKCEIFDMNILFHFYMNVSLHGDMSGSNRNRTALYINVVKKKKHNYVLNLNTMWFVCKYDKTY